MPRVLAYRALSALRLSALRTSCPSPNTRDEPRFSFRTSNMRVSRRCCSSLLQQSVAAIAPVKYEGEHAGHMQVQLVVLAAVRRLETLTYADVC